jgi:hypothetical protein
MVVKLLSILVFATILFACKEKKSQVPKTRKIILEDVFAEGNISDDSVFHGLIKFYDTNTKKLAIEAYYEEGIIDGKRIDYYPNGTMKSLGFYENGKQNGTVIFYDSLGAITSKQDFYYDLKAGNNIVFSREKPSEYYFKSLESYNLFYVNYDSIKDKKIEKINDKSFFFWNINDFTTVSNSGTVNESKIGFIYILNPPDFNFEYSLCVINNKDSILRTEKTFEKSRIWDTFVLDQTKLKAGERYSLRLSFDRSLNDDDGEKGDMLKRL